MRYGALSVVKKFFPKVKRVIDATEDAFIEVTAKDASSKAVKDHNACAMAVACKRKFHLDGVIISRSIAYLVKGNKARRFSLPTSVSREVVSFDRGAGFAPGNYKLHYIPPKNRLGVIHGGHVRENCDDKSKLLRHITTNVRSVLGGKKPEDE